MVSYGKSKPANHNNSDSNPTQSKGSLFKQLFKWNMNSFSRMLSYLFGISESRESSIRWSNKKIKSDSETYPARKLLVSEIESRSPSPRTVLDVFESDYQSTEDSTFSSIDSTISEFSSLTPKDRSHSNLKKQCLSPCKLFFSFFGSPFRRRNRRKEIQQPLLRCFSYEDIMNATNNFHPGKVS